MIKHQNKQPAYREPWFWAVLAPLIVVIVFSFGFAYVAFVGADDRVHDDYYKQGRAINNRFETQKRAQALQLKGQAQFDFAAAEVRLNLHGDQLPGELSLEVSHPLDAQKDASLRLVRVAENLYRADLPQPYRGRRYLVLSAGYGDARWRMTAEVDFDQSAVIDFIPHL